MLDKNPLYKIYKQGRIPVIRFKNEGFVNHNQNEYFSHKGTQELEDICKDIEGCFCLIGGMQDSFILSGVNNTQILNIGSVDKDTKVFIPFKRKWEKAGDVFKENLEDIKNLYSTIPDGFKSRSIDSRNDDFDIFCSQAVINAENIKIEEKIKEEDFKNIWHTMDDEYFKISDGLDFYYIAKKYGQVEDFLKYIDEKGLLKDLLLVIYEEFDDKDIKNFKTLKRYNDLCKKYEEKFNAISYLKKIAPETLNESTKKLDIFDSVIENVDIFPSTEYPHSIKLFSNNKEEKYSYMIKNNKFILKKIENEKEVDIDDKDIFLSKENVEKLSNILKQFILVSKFDDASKLEDTFSCTILKLNNFYAKNDVDLTNDGFIFEDDEYKIEYNYILDDSIILDKHNPEKLLHEEDLILKGKLDNLKIVEDFRKVFVESIFKEELTL